MSEKMELWIEVGQLWAELAQELDEFSNLFVDFLTLLLEAEEFRLSRKKGKR